MTKILIIKLSSLGDVIQALHMLPLIKSAIPNSYISWVVEARFSGVLHSHPLVDKVYEVDTKNWRKKLFLSKESRGFFKKYKENSYDLVLDVQGNSKSALFTFFANGKEKIGFGKKSVSEKLNLLSTKKRFEVDLSTLITDQYRELARKGVSYYQKNYQVRSPLTSLSLQAESKPVSLSLPATSCATDSPTFITPSTSATTNTTTATSSLSPSDFLTSSSPLKEINDNKLIKLSLLGSAKSIEDANNFLASLDFSKGFMVCFGSMWENKRLSLKTWEDFLFKIYKKYRVDFFFVWGSDKEKDFASLLQKSLQDKIILDEHSNLSDTSSNKSINESLNKPIGDRARDASKESLQEPLSEARRDTGNVSTISTSTSNTIYILDKLHLALWQNTMKLCLGVIAVDSSALHLAATCNPFTFGIFGPSSKSVYAPNIEGAYQGNCPYFETFTKRCKKLRDCKTGACIKDIDVDALFSKFVSFEKSFKQNLI